MSPEALETSTLELGQALFDLSRSDDPWVPDAAFWDEALLEFCMRHPALRAELFRFVDVLPCLPPTDVSGHLLEYLGAARAELPAAIRFSVDLSTSSDRLGRIVSRAARRNVLRMARRFIVGTTVGEVLGGIRSLRRRHLAVTLDALGEAVLTEREADQYRDLYLSLLRQSPAVVSRLPEESLADRDHDGSLLPRLNVSIKLSALTSAFDPLDPAGVERSVVPRLRAILDLAGEVGAFVHIDMEQHEKKDLTLALFRDVLSSPRYARRANVGIVLQAYLTSAERDLDDLARWASRRGTPVWVRLVKGAYWDSETILAHQRGWPSPVWEQKWETDACYERCTRALLNHDGTLRAAFASHNVRSVAHALVAARALGLPERRIEFQTLYGMADPLKAALAKVGQRVRVYVPFGDLIPGMAYLVRRLLENTSNESFVRHELAEGEEALALLAPPGPSRPREPIMKKSAPHPEPFPSFANVPLRDFSLRDVRAAFERALSAVELGIHCPVVIDGVVVETAESITSVCPSDARRVVAASGAAAPAQADAAVAHAVQGFAAFRSIPVSERAAFLERAADLMEERRDELSAWACIEAGKPWRDADADTAEAIDFCRFYAAAARELCAPERLDVPGEENRVVHVPRGPTVVVSPWNFPLAIVTGMTAAALVTGNTVVMKPAEQTPACAYQVFRILLEAGVPPSALHFLPGRGEVTGARLVEHPDVATIAFTGSRAVGHLIARRAAETSTGRVGMKRVIAEMGGKNAIVVDADADQDEAIPGVLASAFGYGGQKCSACSRVIVVGAAHDAFVLRLVEAARSLVVGRAEDPAASISPLVDRESVERVARYVAMAERDGRIVFRGELGPGTEHGFFAPPVIVVDVPESSPLSQEEIFGPFLVVHRARDLDEAFRIANGTDYALTGGIYSRSPRNIERARRELDVGNLYVNRRITGALVGRQPFGGHRHSGTGGKAGGRDYLLHFVDAKTITENTLRRGFAKES